MCVVMHGGVYVSVHDLRAVSDVSVLSALLDLCHGEKKSATSSTVVSNFSHDSAPQPGS